MKFVLLLDSIFLVSDLVKPDAVNRVLIFEDVKTLGRNVIVTEPNEEY